MENTSRITEIWLWGGFECLINSADPTYKNSHKSDIGTHLGGHLELRPGTEIPSPDTLLRGIKELSESDIEYTSDRGSKYAFNKAKLLNNLMLDMLLQIGQLKKI